MIILSLNVRGLGGRPKTLGLRSLINSLHPDIILFQETMCSALPSLFSFSKLLPSWEFCAISARGLSGGLLSAWNPLHVKCRAFHTYAGILLLTHIRGLPHPIHVLNVYGPYTKRKGFWKDAMECGILNSPSLIFEWIYQP